MSSNVFEVFKRPQKSESPPRLWFMSDEAFATELLRVAVSQICVAEGFDACEGTAADALVDVLRGGTPTGKKNAAGALWQLDVNT